MTLTAFRHISKLVYMVVKLSPELEARLQKLAATTGRAPDDLVEDAIAGYLVELAQTRNNLDSRYDEIKSGRALPVDGEDVFLQLRKKSQIRPET
jgi:predicted transcriptional regulator